MQKLLVGHRYRTSKPRIEQFLPSNPHESEPTADVVVNGLGDELLTVNDAARFLHMTVPWVY